MSEVAYGVTAQEEELDGLLNSHAGQQPDQVDEIDINASAAIDTSQDSSRKAWAAGTYPVRSTGLRVTKSSSNVDMAVVTFTCLAGPLKDWTRTEFLMLAGKGVTKTCYFLDAVGLYDRDNKKILFKTYAEMLNKDCWIIVEHVKQTSKRGNEFIADAVPFQDGFLSFKDASGKLRFDMPVDNDPFAEPGQVEAPTASTEATRTSAATPSIAAKATSTPPIVSASTEPAPNWT